MDTGRLLESSVEGGRVERARSLRKGRHMEDLSLFAADMAQVGFIFLPVFIVAIIAAGSIKSPRTGGGRRKIAALSKEPWPLRWYAHRDW